MGNAGRSCVNDCNYSRGFWPMKNYWYIARENELLLDCDKGFDIKDAEHIIRIMWREFDETRLLPKICQVEASKTQGHKHVLVIFPEKITKIAKAWISTMLGSDRHREIIAAAQARKGWTNPYLVVSPLLWPDRKPDHVCSHRNWRKCPCLRKIQHPPVTT